MTIPQKLFGTDGIRGLANEYPMVPEVALQLGRAITYLLRKQGKRKPRIVIGKDTRLSGYMLETAIESGVCSMGGHVMLCGPLPTPGVANLVVSMRADAGVVISASHNPYADNGIKLFGRDGFKLPDTMEQRIEALILGDEMQRAGAKGANIGTAFRVEDAQGRYVVFCKSTFPKRLTLEGVRLVVDGAHGAGYRVAPTVFRELGATVYAIGAKPNGRNINRTGALCPSSMANEVLKRKAHLGVALDGDADRLIVVDEKGALVDGDTLMAMCSISMLNERKLPKRTLVTTVMSNLGLERALTRAGGKMVRTPVGDRHVVERMRKSGYGFGGEQSGHLIFLEHATTGDGIVAALQLLSILVRQQRPLSELAQQALERVPQVLVSQRFDTRKPLKNMPHTTKAVAAAKQKLKRDGRVVIRWSGTEAKLRVMVEGDDDHEINRCAKAIIAAAKRDLSA